MKKKIRMITYLPSIIRLKRENPFISGLFISHNIFPHNRKTPETLRFRGNLTLGHKVILR